MKFMYLLSGFIFLTLRSNAQNLDHKPPLDTSAISCWTSLGANAAISNDGKYFLYVIKNTPIKSNTLVIRGIDDQWIKSFSGVSSGGFSEDSKLAIFYSSDTLYLVYLGTHRLTMIPGVKSFKKSGNTKDELIAYKESGFSNNLVLLNLRDGSKKYFNSVIDYSFNNKGDKLLLRMEQNRDTALVTYLKSVNLNNDTIITIWSGENCTVLNYLFSKNDDKLVFMVQHREFDELYNSIWLYNYGLYKPMLLIKDGTSNLEHSFKIRNSGLQFSDNSNWILFKIIRIDKRIKENQNLSKVDLWSYKDVILHSEQVVKLTQERLYTASVNVETKKVTQVEHEDEQIRSPVKGDYVCLVDKLSVSERWRPEYKEKSLYLISLATGNRRAIVKGCDISVLSFSPDGQYLVYYNGELNNYFSYEISTGRTLNITSEVPTKLYKNEYERFPIGVGGWISGHSNILIYDNFDIWKIDPTCQRGPANVTNGYGRKYQFQLRLVDENEKNGYINSDTLLVTEFNSKSKYNGFCYLVLNKKQNPIQLFVGPYTLFHYSIISDYGYNQELNNGIKPIKAKYSNSWIVIRMTSSSAPNYYFTKNFKDYQMLSDLQPQRAYNWLRSELVDWKQLDGSMSQGILYKPEDFDSTRKYPIIFNYYEQLSYRLYEFPEPQFTNNTLNIPWFVSNGYLVFTPDIHFSMANKSGRTNGDNAYNSVVSAARYFMKKAWVDSKRMGIQGHSFGGFETNYLITHTNIFAAAAEASGQSDFVSAYLSLIGPLGRPGGSRQPIAEINQGRMGANLWERKDLYLRNSPILMCDKVSTPLLIMHNKNDGGVPWAQGVEMYMALRRLGKKVWMLQYDAGEHSLSLPKDAIDYTIRLNQFFDYYLKGKLPPIWMTKGLSVQTKGIENGYSLDSSGQMP